MAAEIETQEMRFRCAADHRWVETWPMPMTLMNFGRRMSAASECPRCGAEVFMGWPNEAAATEEQPVCG